MTLFWDGVRRDMARRRVPATPQAGRPDLLPLSFAQERLWFLEQLRPGESTYNISQTFRLLGPLHEARLRDALGRLIERHEVMRTCLRLSDGAPHQQVLECPTLTLPVSAVGSLEEAAAVAAATVDAPFELSAPPLWRFRLLRLARGEHVLVMGVHHLIYDLWSSSVFLRDLGACYATSGPMPPLPWQFADYALWERAQDIGQALAWWRGIFAKRPEPLNLPLDHARPRHTCRDGASGNLVLPETLWTATDSLAKACGVSRYVIHLTAFLFALHALTGQRDLVICTALAGRDRPGAQRLIGCFNSVVPLRFEVDPEQAPSQWIERVARLALEARTNAMVPLQAFSAIPNASEVPLNRLLFSFQNTPPRPSRIGDMAVLPLPNERRAADFELALSVQRQHGGWMAHARYRRDLFEASTIDRLLSGFHEALNQLVTPAAL